MEALGVYVNARTRARVRVCKCADVDIGQVRGVDGVMLTTANLDDVTAAAGTMTSLNVEQHSLFMETITVGYGEVRVCVCESACLCVCVRVCACKCACVRWCMRSSECCLQTLVCTPRTGNHNCKW